MDAAAQVCHHMSMPAVDKAHNAIVSRLCLTLGMFQAVMQEFRDIVIAYGESDEYSFVLRRSTELYSGCNIGCLSLPNAVKKLSMYSPCCATLW